MAHWEYRSVRINTEFEGSTDTHLETYKERDQRIERVFADMGPDGWELVGFLPLSGLAASRNSWIYQAVFKREKYESK